MKALLVAVAGAAILGAPALASGPSPRTIVQTDKTWVCTGPVDLDSVTVTMTPKAAGPRSGEDAIHLQPGCTGTIGKLTVTTLLGSKTTPIGPGLAKVANASAELLLRELAKEGKA